LRNVHRYVVIKPLLFMLCGHLWTIGDRFIGKSSEPIYSEWWKDLESKAAGEYQEEKLNLLIAYQELAWAWIC